MFKNLDLENKSKVTKIIIKNTGALLITLLHTYILKIFKLLAST